MKLLRFALAILTATTSTVIFAGCSGTDYGAGSPYQPGSVAGKTAGNAVGVAAGNVVGFGVGTVEGIGNGVNTTFDRRYHLVRYWKTETTSDGRTIQVPYDVLVDEYGRPAIMPAPTGNPAPPAATNTDTNTPAK